LTTMEDISSKCTGHYSSKFRTFYSRIAARLMRTMWTANNI
jgi:hypothetical protein